MLHDGIARRVAVVGGSRIPFCRSHSIYRNCSNQDLMTAALAGVVNKYDLKGQTIGDVALGAVIKHSRDWNLARESAMDSGLSMRTPGVDLQRACGTSLEACAMIANKIALGQINSGIAGGTDTISDAATSSLRLTTTRSTDPGNTVEPNTRTEASESAETVEPCALAAALSAEIVSGDASLRRERRSGLRPGRP